MIELTDSGISKIIVAENLYDKGLTAGVNHAEQ